MKRTIKASTIKATPPTAPPTIAPVLDLPPPEPLLLVKSDHQSAEPSPRHSSEVPHLEDPDPDPEGLPPPPPTPETVAAAASGEIDDGESSLMHPDPPEVTVNKGVLSSDKSSQ
jgi:hypothetical protein